HRRSLSRIRRAGPHSLRPKRDFRAFDDAVAVRVRVALDGPRPVAAHRVAGNDALLVAGPEENRRAVELLEAVAVPPQRNRGVPAYPRTGEELPDQRGLDSAVADRSPGAIGRQPRSRGDRKSTRLNSSHEWNSYAV